MRLAFPSPYLKVRDLTSASNQIRPLRAGSVLAETQIVLRGAAHHTTTVQATALGTIRFGKHSLGVVLMMTWK
ncbi:MAG TPA: hypothetical protein DCE44_06060 [Verrucomicrobiales bacterium]|nr:hypothetical protein [Verrucomicrobiales bacterium]